MPFQVGTRILIEPGCREQLTGILAESGWKRPMLVTDAGLMQQAMVQELWDGLGIAGVDGVCFDEVECNPRTTTAERIAAIAVESQRDVILGLGGGSSIDAAKAAAMLATNGGLASDYVGRQVFPEDPLPLVAIPTTCGTGSEVTWVAVLTDFERKTKISLKGSAMFPDLALVDSGFLQSLPPSLLATTAIDALTHALEATTGSRRNPVSDALAEKAIVLLLDHLRLAFEPARDGAALEAVMQASTLAGLAFGNADVAAVHCLSESIGGIHDLPHGLCNAILLVPVLRAHGGTIAGRLSELDAMACGKPVGSAEHLLDRIESLIADLEIPGFTSLGIAPEDDPRLAEAAVQNGSNDSNPRPMREADYFSILQGLR